MSALVELLPKTVDGLILSAPLVPPTLDGRKTCTRRISKKWLRLKAGDLLFVRENWKLYGWLDGTCTLEYPAGDHPDGVSFGRLCRAGLKCPGDWLLRESKRVEAFIAKQPTNTTRDPLRARPLRPSILLPRWASRCVLRVTEKPRLERVQDITEEDAKREGVERGPACDETCTTPFRCGFIDTWHRLHTKPGERFNDGPSVVRIAFERAA